MSDNDLHPERPDEPWRASSPDDSPAGSAEGPASEAATPAPTSAAPAQPAAPGTPSTAPSTGAHESPTVPQPAWPATPGAPAPATPATPPSAGGPGSPTSSGYPASPSYTTPQYPTPGYPSAGPTPGYPSANPTPSHPTSGPGYPTSGPGYPTSGSGYPAVGPTPGYPTPGYPTPGSGYPGAPAAGPSGAPVSGPSGYPAPVSGSAGYPGAPVSGPSGYPASVSGTPTSAQPGQPAATDAYGTAPTSSYGAVPGEYGPAPQYPAAPGYPGQPNYPGQPGHPGQHYAGQPNAGQPRRGGVGKVLATGLLALLLAGGGGVVGGLVVHATDDNSTSTSSNGGTGTTQVLDRSSLASVVAKVKSSVVAITTGTGEGSGIVISPDGYIITNNHVVADAGKKVNVNFSDGSTVSATVVGTDVRTDIGVVKVDNAKNLNVATFGDSNALQVGDTVLAIGSPLGLEGSVTAGIVSALNRTIDESDESGRSTGVAIAGAIQTDAAINPGNSGGALVNMAGEVVGINTAIATAGQSSGNIGVGFAIPGNRAKEVATAIIKGEKVSHPYLGVSVATADGNVGAQISSVVDGSPADKAGLKEGDVITKAGDKAIHTSDDLLNVVQTAKVGQQVQLTVNRGGSSSNVTVTIGEAPN